MTGGGRWGRATLLSAMINGGLLLAAALLVAVPVAPTEREYLPIDLITLEPIATPVTPAPPPKPEPKPVVKPAPAKPIPKEPEIGVDETAPPAPPEPTEESLPPEPVYHPVEAVSAPPGFLKRARPAYPEAARRRGEETRVMVEVFLEPNGMVARVDVLESGGERFDAAVIEALKKSRFSPARIDGKPVRVRVRIPFNFRLR